MYWLRGSDRRRRFLMECPACSSWLFTLRGDSVVFSSISTVLQSTTWGAEARGCQGSASPLWWRSCPCSALGPSCSQGRRLSLGLCWVHRRSAWNLFWSAAWPLRFKIENIMIIILSQDFSFAALQLWIFIETGNYVCYPFLKSPSQYYHLCHLFSSSLF